MRFDDVGVATSASRPLQGQAENIYNLQLGYDGDVHDFTVAFNRVGRRLFRPGTQSRPDIFREPLDVLDLTWRYQPWDDVAVGLELSNILNPTVETLQADQIYESYQAGTSGSLFLNWTFY